MDSPRLFRYTAATCGLFLLAGAVAVGVGLAPLGARQNVPWRLVWPLWTGALAAVLEIAVLVGTPLGVSLSRSSAARGGDEPAERSGSGSVPWRRTFGFLALWFASTAALGGLANMQFGAPGNTLRGVIRSAREECEERHADASVSVPLLGARWVCSPPLPASLVGELSRGGVLARYVTRGIELSEDLGSVGLSNLELSVTLPHGTPAMRLKVQTAHLRGAWPWARQTPAFGMVRAIYVSAVAAMIAALSMVMTHSRRVHPRIVGSLLASTGAGTALYVLRSLDAYQQSNSVLFVLVPIAAALAMICLNWLIRVELIKQTGRMVVGPWRALRAALGSSSSANGGDWRKSGDRGM